LAPVGKKTLNKVACTFGIFKLNGVVGTANGMLVSLDQGFA
jgi:hypothetical protein